MESTKALAVTKAIQHELAEYAKTLATKHGVTFRKTHGSYSTVDLKVKIEFILDAEAKAAEKLDADTRLGKYIGLIPGERVEYQGVTYQVTGYSPKGKLEVVREHDGRALMFREMKGATYGQGYAYLKRIGVAA